MLVEKVVEVYLGEYFRLQALFDALGLQLILKYSNLHQKQCYHPFFHEYLEGLAHILDLLALEHVAEGRILHQVSSILETLIFELHSEPFPFKVLYNLITALKQIA